MTDFLATLNSPKAAEESAKWEAEVIKAAEPEPAPEPIKAEPAPVVETVKAEPEPAPVKAEQPAPEEKYVPLKALHETRNELNEYKRKLADLEARFNNPPPPQEQYEEPDPEQDPIGALKYTRQQLADFQRAQQAQQQETYVAQAYAASAQQFAAQTDDFRDAYNYAIQSRANELAALGAPQDQIPNLIRQEELQIAATALQQGRNPAEVIYNFAKARNYVKAAPPPPPAPALVTPDPAKEKAKADAAVSLTAGGKPPANAMTAEDALATLKGAALETWMAKHWGEMEAAAGRKSSLFRQ